MPGEARELAAFYAANGVDTLKVYSELSPDSYAALADAARAKGISIAGHRPLSVSLEQAIGAGQRSIEHGRLFSIECFAGADDFRALDRPISAYNADLRRRLIDEQDPTRCAALMQRMADSDTAWTPTLLTLRMEGFANDPGYRDDERLRYIPWVVRRLMWFPDADRMAASAIDAEGRNVRCELYRLARRSRSAGTAPGAGFTPDACTARSCPYAWLSIRDDPNPGSQPAHDHSEPEARLRDRRLRDQWSRIRCG